MKFTLVILRVDGVWEYEILNEYGSGEEDRQQWTSALRAGFILPSNSPSILFSHINSTPIHDQHWRWVNIWVLDCFHVSKQRRNGYKASSYVPWPAIVLCYQLGAVACGLHVPKLGINAIKFESGQKLRANSDSCVVALSALFERVRIPACSIPEAKVTSFPSDLPASMSMRTMARCCKSKYDMSKYSKSYIFKSCRITLIGRCNPAHQCIYQSSKHTGNSTRIDTCLG